MSTKKGFTLVEIMIVVAIIALLTAIAIPAFLQYRQDARRGLCINNLRLIDHAKEVMAIRKNWTTGYVLTAGDLTNLDAYIDGSSLPVCPDNPSVPYTYNPVDTIPQCTLGVEHVYDPGR
jgi:prepilin-type N-terminal cleavage/methylation domain-containing protein